MFFGCDLEYLMLGNLLVSKAQLPATADGENIERPDE
jgi:hypothetical protein